MIKYIKGDLFDTKAYIIAHGVNCVGGFGSGIAGLIAKKYPHVRRQYLEKFNGEGWKLGDVQFAPLYDHRSRFTNMNCPFYIANCATQKEYYPRNKVHADYDAIRTCMDKVKKFAKDIKWDIAVPKLGAGLAGGDWNVIEKILSEVFSDYDIAVHYLEDK